MEIEAITIKTENGNQKEYYPLLQITMENKNYIIYTTDKENLNKEELYVGQITPDNNLIPVNETEYQQLDQYIQKIINLNFPT